ncbi:MAG: cytidylate kinase [Alphaproteobacteria bacterium]|nr:cytidylate kinase [Alphaproteobacteria bacterium]
MPLRITIAGDIGSGKSTVARRIAGIIGVQPLSIGVIQRELAKKRGVTTLELNQIAEKNTAIDEEIDAYMKGLPSGDLLVDARLGWHFVQNTLKVYLYISDFEAARRVLRANRIDEAYNQTSAASKILARRTSEVDRFRRYYGVNIDDISNYDLVIDTTLASLDEVVRKIQKFLLNPLKLPARYVSPKNMIPTRGIRDLASERVDNIGSDIVANGYNVINPISALYVNHRFYILDGHARVAASIRNELTFVPVSVKACDNESYMNGVTALQYVSDSVNDSRVYDWEAALEFRFRDPIWKSSSRVT